MSTYSPEKCCLHRTKGMSNIHKRSFRARKEALETFGNQACCSSSIRHIPPSSIVATHRLARSTNNATLHTFFSMAHTADASGRLDSGWRHCWMTLIKDPHFLDAVIPELLSPSQMVCTLDVIESSSWTFCSPGGIEPSSSMRCSKQ